MKYVNLFDNRQVYIYQINVLRSLIFVLILPKSNVSAIFKIRKTKYKINIIKFERCITTANTMYENTF